MKVVAYIVTAQRRDFRRVGRDFKIGVPTRVVAKELTTAQADHLADSDPRDLIVDKVYEPREECQGEVVAMDGESVAAGSIVAVSVAAAPAPKKGRGK